MPAVRVREGSLTALLRAAADERVLEYFLETDHERAGKGTANGGQFVAKGTSGTASPAVGKLSYQGTYKPDPTRSSKGSGGQGGRVTGPVEPVTKAIGLKLRDSGAQVQALQKLLALFGFELTDEFDKRGNYGRQTEAAVKALQQKLGLKPTGRADVSLQRRLADAALLMQVGRASEAWRMLEAEYHTGAMLALLPSEEDAERLAEVCDEDDDQLHCTLLYLGDGADLDDDDRAGLVSAVRDRFAGLDPVQVDGFAVSVFNPPGVTQGDGKQRDTCIVLGLSGEPLATVRRLADEAAAEAGVDLPDQHAPWTPHVTLAYTDDLGRLAGMAKAAGPITFDRVRLAFAGEHTDIPLRGTSEARVTSMPRTALGLLALVRAVERYNPDQLRAPRGTGIGGRWVKGLVSGLGGPAPEEGPRPDIGYSLGYSPDRRSIFALKPRKPRADDRVITTDRVGERPRIGHVQAVRGDEVRVRWDDTGEVETRPVAGLQVAGLPEVDPARTFVAEPQDKVRMSVRPGQRPTGAQVIADEVAAGRLDSRDAARLMRGESPESIADDRSRYEAPAKKAPAKAPTRRTASGESLGAGDTVEWHDRQSGATIRGTVVQDGRLLSVDWEGGRRERLSTRGLDSEIKKVRSDAPSPAKPSPRKPAKAAPASDLTGESRQPNDSKAILTRLQSFSDPPSRDAAHELVAPLTKVQLREMAKTISVPKAASLDADQLRREIVEATAGRRLDSIAVRGFRGERPGELVVGQDRLDLPGFAASVVRAPRDGSADPVLSAIAHEQGFDGRPKVVSRAQFDQLVAGGAKPIYRGVVGDAGDEHLSAAEVQERFRTGPAFYGEGHFGNGIYFGSSKDATRDFNDHTPGSTLTAVIMPGARRISYDDIEEQRRAYRAAHVPDDPDPMVPDWHDRISDDTGRFAAAKGYDVIDVPGDAPNGSEDTHVVLNRTVLAVASAGVSQDRGPAPVKAGRAAAKVARPKAAAGSPGPDVDGITTGLRGRRDEGDIVRQLDAQMLKPSELDRVGAALGIDMSVSGRTAPRKVAQIGYALSRRPADDSPVVDLPAPARVDPAIRIRSLAAAANDAESQGETAIVASLADVSGPDLRKVAKELGITIPARSTVDAIRAHIARSLASFSS